MSNETNSLSGGCLCGQVRYQVSAAPFAAEYCHCRMCQRASGAPVVCWMDFMHDQVRWTSAQPVEYSSSEHARRGFCATCGGTVSYRDTRYPQYLTLSIASLDTPEACVPDYHIYTASQLAWFRIDDQCQRFAGAKAS